jgi:hypothetical protein
MQTKRNRTNIHLYIYICTHQLIIILKHTIVRSFFRSFFTASYILIARE